MTIYAMYKGEECLSIGTIYEVAEELNVKVETLRFYLTPTYKKRAANRKERSEGRRILVKLEED